MSKIDEKEIRAAIEKATVPLVLKGFVKDWTFCKWDLKKWTSVFGNREIPLRCMNKGLLYDEPCWERKCSINCMKFCDFLSSLNTTKEWMYFDYKYLHQWFNADSEILQELSWNQFGYPNKGATDTTLWIGTKGAHTPAHRDTYGVNVVAQVYGKKRWLLFPPETTALKPTRVPYEESSVYSELNFYCPSNLEPFQNLNGCHMVELDAGDALIVPRGWWHYVQNVGDVNIALNMWLPHEKDSSTRVSEALVKIFVAQLCKDLPDATRRLLLNPNEDDITDTPLAVLFLELETVAEQYIQKKRKLRRMKRQKTENDDDVQNTDHFDINTLLVNSNFQLAEVISGEKVVSLIENNIKEFDKSKSFDDIDGSTSGLGLTKALINAYSESAAIEQIKQNLLTRLSADSFR